MRNPLRYQRAVQSSRHPARQEGTEQISTPSQLQNGTIQLPRHLPQQHGTVQQSRHRPRQAVQIQRFQYGPPELGAAQISTSTQSTREPSTTDEQLLLLDIDSTSNRPPQHKATQASGPHNTTTENLVTFEEPMDVSTFDPLLETSTFSLSENERTDRRFYPKTAGKWLLYRNKALKKSMLWVFPCSG